MEPSLDSFFAFFKQFNFYGAANANGTQGFQPYLFFSSKARGERPADGKPLENLLTAIPGGEF